MNQKPIALLVATVAVIALVVAGCAPEAVTPEEEKEAVPAPEEKEEAPAAPTAETIKWRVSADNPMVKSTTANHKIFVDMVNEMANGQMELTYYEGGAIANWNNLFDYASEGVIEAGITVSAIASGKNSAFDPIGTLPTYLTPHERRIWIYEAGGLELCQEMFAEYNIYALPLAVQPLEGGFRTSEVQIRELSDFKGLQLRGFGKIEKMVLEALGATQVSMGQGDAYTALQTGVIDGADLGPISDDWNMGFQEVAPFVSTPSWYAVGDHFFLLLNMDAWNSLPDHLKAMITTAAAATCERATAMFFYQDMTGAQQWEDYGTTVVPLSDAALDRIQEEVAKAIEAEAAANPDFKRIVKSQLEFLKLSASFNDAYPRRFSNGLGLPVVWPQLD